MWIKLNWNLIYSFYVYFLAHIYKCYQHVPGKLKRYFCLPNGQHSDLITFSGPVISVLESYINHYIVLNKVNEDWNCPITGVDHDWLSGGGKDVNTKKII